MKIAIVHSFYSESSPSGENAVVRDQMDVLSSAGLDVHLFYCATDSLRGSEFYKARSAVNVALRRGNNPTRYLSGLRPDVVHIHNTFPNIGTRWIADWPGPIAMSFHNYRSWCINGTFFRSGRQCTDCISHHHLSIPGIVHRCYRGSIAASIPPAVSRRGFRDDSSHDNVIHVATSEGSYAKLSSLRTSERPVVQVPNFVIDRGGHRAPEQVDAWLALGRFDPEKGFLQLIRDWPSTHRLRILGSGPQENAIREAVRGRANIHLSGPVPRDELRKLIDSHVGLVFPSLWFEVAPQAVVEAMSAGTPVIAHRANVVSGLLERTGSGIAYGDAEELTAALDNVRDNWSVVSQQARRVYESEWTPQIWLRRTLNLYHLMTQTYGSTGSLRGLSLGNLGLDP